MKWPSRYSGVTYKPYPKMFDLNSKIHSVLKKTREYHWDYIFMFDVSITREELETLLNLTSR